jgi:hypothetical protein
MEFKGSLSEFGVTRKEKKNETEIVHKLKAGEKGDFS